MKFEVVSKYADADINLPVRKTKASAGYDFQVAEDTIIPSYVERFNRVLHDYYQSRKDIVDLNTISNLTKKEHFRPTLVPTGIKCEMPEDMYLELSVRSSCPLKHWLILANGIGIIDSDYYNNPDNEGHIFFQIINLSPFDIILKKGDTIGQGILKKYFVTDNDAAYGKRAGGFGSTDNINIDINLPSVLTPDECRELGVKLSQLNEDECVMACNPNRFPYLVGKRRELLVFDEAATFTTENHDVEYSCT